MTVRRGRARWLVIGGGVACLALRAATLLRLLPGSGGALGHDWSYFLPQLLAGSYWMRGNGVLDVPWFTPAWLGGVPFHANPQNLFYSLPQQLCRVVDPLVAVRLTVVLTAAVALSSTYLLLRRAFGLRRPAAASGAVLFAWNGYFASRMLIGHLVYHTFALLPFVALCLLGAPRRGRPETLRRGVLAGAALAAMIHACDLHGLPVVLLAVVALRAVQCLAGRSAGRFVARCGVAAFTALLLAASKVLAMATFLAHFPRDGYALPGCRNAFDALRLAAAAVFWRAPTGLAHDLLVNAPWRIERHELEYGVTPVAALAILVGVLLLVRRRPALRVLPLAVLAVVLAVPLALNVHAPAWEAALKSVPLLGSGTNLLRTFSLYVPLAVVLAALALDRLRLAPRHGAAVAALGVALVIAWHVTDDHTHYATQPYRADRVVAAWRDLARTGTVPPVVRLGTARDAAGAPTFPVGRNEAFVDGTSALTAFEPVFGYRLEWLPAGDVGDGPALPPNAAPNAAPNVRDPARFLWPDKNGGAPGTSFPAARRDDAAAFLAYRPYPFGRPWWQRAADALNVAALVALVLAAVAAAVRRPVSACSRRRPPPVAGGGPV